MKKAIKPIKSWNEVRSYLATSTLKDYQKEFARQSVDFIERQLGVVFFDGAHPLNVNFCRGSEFLLLWCQWLSDILQKNFDPSGSERMLAKLRGKLSAQEALSIIFTVGVLSSAGLNVVLLPEETSQKSPDLSLGCSGSLERMAVEVAVLETSAADRLRMRGIDKVSDEVFSLNERGINFGIWVFRYLSLVQADELSRQIEKIANLSEKNKSIEYFDLPGTAWFVAASGDKREAFFAYCKERSLLPNTFIGPRLDSGDLRRIKRKIGDEAKQIIGEEAGVLVIQVPEDVFAFHDDHHAQKVFAEIEDHLASCENVALLILFSLGSQLFFSNSQKNFGIHRAVSFSAIEGWGANSIMVINKYSHRKVAVSLLSRVIEAFYGH